MLTDTFTEPVASMYFSYGHRWNWPSSRVSFPMLCGVLGLLSVIGEWENRTLFTVYERSYLDADTTVGYQNPIIPGFNPDPTFLRTGDDYFIATSTFEFL